MSINSSYDFQCQLGGKTGIIESIHAPNGLVKNKPKKYYLLDFHSFCSLKK